jgi:threonine/homoserine/homoserine lactone efflux protein
MTPSALLIFTIAFALACASPGPTIAALVARVLGRGTAGAPSLCAGLLLSDLLWLAAAVFGLSLIATTLQPIFLFLKWAGVAYLLFLAYKLWTAPVGALPNAAPVKGEGFKLFATGVSIGSGNPKTMLFYSALLPSLVDLHNVTWLGFAELAAVVVVVYGAILAGYVILAARARKTFTSPRAMRIVNRTTGAVMGGAALAIASR